MIEINFLSGTDTRVNQYQTFVYAQNGQFCGEDFIHFPLAKLNLSCGAQSSMRYFNELKISVDKSENDASSDENRASYHRSRALVLLPTAVRVVAGRPYLAIATEDSISPIGAKKTGGQASKTVSVHNTAGCNVDVYWYVDDTLVGVCRKVPHDGTSKFHSQFDLVFSAQKSGTQSLVEQATKSPQGCHFSAITSESSELTIAIRFRNDKPYYIFKPSIERGRH